MAPGEWKGDFNTTMITIVSVVCFSWVPVVITISLYQHFRRRSRAKKDSANATADPEKAPPRKPYVPMKQPEYVPMPVVSRPDRAASIRTINSVSSWEPTRRDWRDTASNSYLPPRGSPADSLRASPRYASRTSFQINNAFYDTTPLPENAPDIKAAYAKSAAERSHRRSSEHRRSMEAGPSNPLQKQRSSHSTARSRPAAKLDSSSDGSPPLMPSLPPSVFRPQSGSEGEPTSDDNPPPMPPPPPSVLRPHPGPAGEPTSDESPPPMPKPPCAAARPLKGILVSRRDESPPPQMPPAPRSVSRPRGNATPADPRTRRPSLSSAPVAGKPAGATSSSPENPTEAPVAEAFASRVPRPRGSSLGCQTSPSSLQNGGGTS